MDEPDSPKASRRMMRRLAIMLVIGGALALLLMLSYVHRAAKPPVQERAGHAPGAGG